MCGIVGIVSKNKITNLNCINSMVDKISKRGPDGKGFHYDNNFIFGHSRLSIFDISKAGHQPMYYKDRYVITFNGEIYNFIELKDELKKYDYTFKSNTDTEVIMASYDHWGTDCVKYFNGMWAFVIYDMVEEKFFMSRDRFGKKPFYYYLDNEYFIFGSEIKSLLEHPHVKSEANMEYLNEYLLYGNKEYLKETSFKNIYRFDFASYFEGTLEDLFDNFDLSVFWKIQPNLSQETFDQDKANKYAQEYYELLKDAVRIRLRADVVIGSALSGGLDSSSIVYLINQILQETNSSPLQETFSSVYNTSQTKYCDESKYIDIMVNKLSIHSNKIEPVEKDIPEEIEKMVYALETPPPNSLMSSWYTFKLVNSKQVKVTLDGQGADEQLCGYLPYIMNYIVSLDADDLLKESFHCFKINNAKKYVFLGVLLWLFNKSLGERLLKKIIKFLTKKEFEINLNEKLVREFQTNLVSLLHYADHTSMAFSVESRMPFMDYRLVEFLASVPACYKMRNGWTKYIARLAFDGKLPNEITWRSDKMGWPIPEKVWFNGKLKQWFLQQSEKCFLCRQLKKIKKSHNSFQVNMRKLNISLWEKIFLGSKK